MTVMQFRPSSDLLSGLLEGLTVANPGVARSPSLLRAPAADVVETETGIRVEIELPGMSPDDILIDIENNVLTIGGEKKLTRAEQEKEPTWHLSERRYGQFSRSFVLPRDVEQDRIEAHFSDGVLRLVVPKSERARRRRIEIGENGSGNAQEVEAGTSRRTR